MCFCSRLKSVALASWAGSQRTTCMLVPAIIRVATDSYLTPSCCPTPHTRVLHTCAIGACMRPHVHTRARYPAAPQLSAEILIYPNPYRDSLPNDLCSCVHFPQVCKSIFYQPDSLRCSPCTHVIHCSIMCCLCRANHVQAAMQPQVVQAWVYLHLQVSLAHARWHLL